MKFTWDMCSFHVIWDFYRQSFSIETKKIDLSLLSNSTRPPYTSVQSDERITCFNPLWPDLFVFRKLFLFHTYRVLTVCDKKISGLIIAYVAVHIVSIVYIFFQSIVAAYNALLQPHLRSRSVLTVWRPRMFYPYKKKIFIEEKTGGGSGIKK